MNRFYIIVFFIGFYLTVQAQTDTVPNSKEEPTEIEQRVENLAEGVDNSSADYTTLLDGLLYFSEHPLNINTATAQDLLELGLLTEIQINAILNHIKTNGKLLTIYELQSIDELDLSTIQKILPYIKVNDSFNNPNLSWNEIKKYGQHQLISRWSRTLEQQQGYAPIDPQAYAMSPNSRYLGSPDNLFLRYRFNYGNFFSIGFAAEKDAGEVFLNTKKRTGNPQKDSILEKKLKPGFDFYTYHFYARNIWKFKQIALGDYQLSIGQGAVFSTGLAFGKTADILSIKRNAIGIKPYTSVNPSLLLRGAAVNISHKNIELLAWGSNKKIDGTVVSPTAVVIDSLQAGVNDAAFEDIQISSVQLSGFHRTPGELEKKESVTEQIMGGRVAFTNGRRLTIGVTQVLTKYSASFTPNNKPYNKFDFAGNSNSNTGLDYNFIWRNINFYGEFGRSKNGGMASVLGALISLDPRLTLVVHYRNFQKNYQALHANALSENTAKQNEQGLYTGLLFKPNSLYSATVYFDKFYFPWLKYQVSAPSGGYDFFSQFNYTPNRKTTIYARFRNRLSQRDYADNADEIDYLNNIKQRNYRIEASYPVSNSFTLKQRIERVDYLPEHGNTEVGYYFFNDVSYKALSSPWQFTWRYGVFETQGYNSRIYAYEKEVLYAYSIPAVYNKGIRTYLLVRYTVMRGFDIWFRIGSTIYDQQNVISSGTNQINGNHKTDVRIQLRYKF
jgi:hypothetical protein